MCTYLVSAIILCTYLVSAIILCTYLVSANNLSEIYFWNTIDQVVINNFLVQINT